MDLYCYLLYIHNVIGQLDITNAGLVNMMKFRENFCLICLLTNRAKNVIMVGCCEIRLALWQKARERADQIKNRALRTARSVLTYQPIIEMLGWQIP